MLGYTSELESGWGIWNYSASQRSRAAEEYQDKGWQQSTINPLSILGKRVATINNQSIVNPGAKCDNNQQSLSL